jgi:hypothetical protein
LIGMFKIHLPKGFAERWATEKLRLETKFYSYNYSESLVVTIDFWHIVSTCFLASNSHNFE